MPRCGKCFTSQLGQGLVEYTFIILLVALVVFGALLVLGPVVASAIHGVVPAL
jgi:Flp pilus assembly pilin Flp